MNLDTVASCVTSKNNQSGVGPMALGVNNSDDIAIGLHGIGQKQHFHWHGVLCYANFHGVAFMEAEIVLEELPYYAEYLLDVCRPDGWLE